MLLKDQFCRSLLVAALAISPCFTTLAEEQVTLSLDNAEIIDLVRWAQDVTGKNIIVHPNVKGRVTVLAGDGMSKAEAYEVFLSVLQVHGLTVVQDQNSLKVIPDAQAKSDALPVVDGTGVVAREDMVVQVVKVQNVSAANLLNLLRPMIPQSGYIAAYPQTNMIILADRANKIQQITDIIDRMDQVGVIDIELIALEFASAREVSDVISKLLPQQAGNNDASSFTLAVDERSNSLLMTGDPVTRQQIRSLVERLDQPLQGQGNTQVVKVQYTSAKELIPLLKSVSGSVQKRTKDQGLADMEVSIEAHEQLNALVITAPPSVLATMRGVVKELDVPRAQVFVEALIVEVNEDLTHNLGIQWQSNQPGSEGSDTFGGFNSFPSGLTPLGIDDDGSTILGSGFSFGYFRGGNLRGIMNALAGETDANILSTPTILALDNEEASILVGANVPFITGSQQRPGDINAFQTIQREDIGLTLKVKPHVNNDDSVTLEIEQTVESIAPSAIETADIVTNKREVKTKVLIGDDQVLVLGGLIRDDYTETENKVPLLGDIPLLGKLFKSTSVTMTKANLMVFIHPKILRNPASLGTYSQGKYNDMRDRQLNFRNDSERFFILKDKPLLPELRPIPSTEAEAEAESKETEQTPSQVEGSDDSGNK